MPDNVQSGLQEVLLRQRKRKSGPLVQSFTDEGYKFRGVEALIHGGGLG